MRSFALVLGLIVLASECRAQYGNASYNFFGPAGSQSTNKPTAISTMSTMTVVGTPDEPTVNMINSKQWVAQLAADPLVYYSFSVTAAQPVSMTSLFVNAFSSNVGPRNLDLRSSRDNFTATIGTASITQNVLSPRTFNLPAASFESIGTGQTVEFRIYGYNASNNGTNSTLGFQSGTAATNGVVLTVGAPVPEPMILAPSLIAMLGLLGGFAGRRI